MSRNGWHQNTKKSHFSWSDNFKMQIWSNLSVLPLLLRIKQTHLCGLQSPVWSGLPAFSYSSFLFSPSSYLGFLFTMLPLTTGLCMFSLSRMFFPSSPSSFLYFKNSTQSNSSSAFPDTLGQPDFHFTLRAPGISSLLPWSRLQSFTYCVIIWLISMFLKKPKWSHSC